MALETWDIDTSHSSVHFSVRHMVFAKAHGKFTRWSGTVAYDPQNPEASKVSASIEAASVDTSDEKRDGHLRSADFLDVEKFPTLTFASKRVEPSGDGLKVTGDLTLHGQTHEVTLEVESLGGGKDPWGNARLGFSGATRINRRDFGLEWNQVLEAGGVLVGEKIEIAIDVELVKAAKAAA